MKEIIGFLGRLFFVYGIPMLMFVGASNMEVGSAWVVVVAVLWMWIFHYVTTKWEDWGK